jgi:DNA-binding NarL/FixJ family response regulator
MGDPIRVLLCEDQTLMREGLRTILELEPEMEVAGEAADGEQAVARARALAPDVVLMDVEMPRLDGISATRRILAERPTQRIILLTTFDYDDYVLEGVRAGAMGYLLKSAPAEELMSTLRRVHAGEQFIQPGLALRLLRELGGRERTGAPAGAEALSERELEVLRLLGDGASNREIAEALFLAEGTVKNHVSSILGKLQAANRTEAAKLARQRRLI